MKLLDVLVIIAVMFLFLLVSMSQERDIKRINHNIKLNTQRITNLENPQFIQESYKPKKKKGVR